MQHYAATVGIPEELLILPPGAIQSCHPSCNVRSARKCTPDRVSHHDQNAELVSEPHNARRRDLAKFDALLRRIAESKPTSLEQVKAVPKIRKDGQAKRGKAK
jgi:hypothetical protein